jgi:hypothetical protein
MSDCRIAIYHVWRIPGADGVYIVEIEVKAFGRKMTICPALMSVVKAQY